MAAVCRFISLALVLQFFQETNQSKLTVFGAKTPYSYQYSNNSLEYPGTCTPIHIEYVSRHGSRFPSKGDRKKTNNLLKKLDGFYNLSNPFKLKNLTFPWTKWNEWKDADFGELSARNERTIRNCKTIAFKFPRRF